MRRNWIAVLCLSLAIIIVTYSAKVHAGRRVVPSTAPESASGEEAKQIECTGKVVDEQAEPIAGVQVRLYELVYGETVYLYDTKLVEEVTTKADGAFSFSTSAERNGYRYGVIMAEKQGLAIGWANWDMREEQQDVEITLGEAKELAGVVVDENDKPILDVEVSISFLLAGEREKRRYLTTRTASKLLTVRTDTKGKFVFGNLPADCTAEFVVKKPGRATVSTFPLAGYRGEKLQFAAGQTDIKLIMPVEAKIEGIVVEKASSKPIGGVKLIAMQERNQPAFGQEPITSKEDGTFNINALAAGKYTLQLVPSKEKLADWVAEPVEVTTETGKTKGGVKVELSKGGILEVVITEAESKKPVEKAGVSIRDEQNDQWLSASSDENGIARIRLVPGEYQISGVYKQGYSQQRRQETVTIEDGKTERFEWQLTGQPKITGLVLDEADKPLKAVKLKVLPMGGRDATSNDEGKFEVNWDPHRWGQEETVHYLVARHVERNLAAAVEIDEDTKMQDVKLKPGVIFTGKVVDPEGKAIEGATITVNMREGRWGSPIGRDGDKTNSAGSFEVRAIPTEHRYNVYARAEGYGEKIVEAHADNALDNQLDVGKLTLALANLSVSGVVVDADDKPVADARISASGEGQPHRYNIQTDAEGKFTIEKICAGRIRISANTSGKARLYGSVESEGGATDVKVVVSERPSSTRYVPKQPPYLVGKALPELKELKIELLPADVNDKMILICFWDMQQRPSRYCIRQVAKKAEQFKQQGVTVVAVQASKIDENTLSQWVKKYNIPFPVGMVKGDAEKTHFTWGVRSLPWLILTDRKHIVTAERLGLAELDAKIEATMKQH